MRSKKLKKKKIYVKKYLNRQPINVTSDTCRRRTCIRNFVQSRIMYMNQRHINL